LDRIEQLQRQHYHADEVEERMRNKKHEDESIQASAIEPVPDVEHISYVSLTDVARKENRESPGQVIQSWLRSRNTLEFLRIWELKNNSDFDEHECAALFEAMRAPSFTATPKQWIAKTKAIGIVSKQGKGGGTFAHPDIAMDFLMWLKPELRLELVKRIRESGGKIDDMQVKK